MKQKTLDKILFQNFMYLILITALLIGIFSAIVDACNTLSNERKNMYDSLQQAQGIINNQTQMIEDYLTLTHADPSLQSKLVQLQTDGSASLLSSINKSLFSVDLFKKTLDSMQVFIYESQSDLPAFSTVSYHSNALFSTESVADQRWFLDTVAAGGSTVWFLDSVHFGTPTVCASRILYDLRDAAQPLGLIRANVSVEKLTRHLSSLSFQDIH